MRGLGLKRTTPGRADHRLGAHRLGLIGTPKGQADLAEFMPPRLDQGQTSTCHAHSFVAALFTACGAQGHPMPFVGSPLLLASSTYADVRAKAHPTGDLPPLSDDGAQLQDDADAARTWGIGPMGLQVPGRYSDVPDDQDGVPFPEPTVPALIVAGTDLIDGEYSIPVNSDAPEVCALALDEGIPIWLGTMVDTAFEHAGPSDVIGPANPSDPSGGGHALYLGAYRTNAPGALEFRVENSWGPNWCAGGAVWASSEWIKACWDLWPMAVKS